MIDISASIKLNGAIEMGNLVCVDGHSYGRNHFVFSHLHHDHTNELHKCLYNGNVYMSKPTRDLLEAINIENYGSGNIQQIKRLHIFTMDYKKPILVGDDVKEEIILHESSHVLGSSQIEVIMQNNKKILYSGDITPDDRPPHKVDVLIVDPTHGHPRYENYSDQDSLERRFLELVETKLNDAKTIVIHAHRGKLQEIMSLISKHDKLNSFHLYSNSKNAGLAKVYEKYGHHIRQLIQEKSTKSGEFPVIKFTTSYHKSEEERIGSHFSIFFYDTPHIIHNESETTAIFNTTAHPGFTNLLEYVKCADPEEIIVDNYRTKQGNSFAKHLRMEGYDAKAQPCKSF